jgi:hypothetical protein
MAAKRRRKKPRKRAAGRPAASQRSTTAGAFALAVAVFGGCADEPATPVIDRGVETVAEAAPDPQDAAVDDLIAYAAKRRAEIDFTTQPPWREVAGADPYALLHDGDRTLGLERRGRLVVLDPRGDPGDTPRTIETVVGASALRRVGDTLVIASETTGELDVVQAESLAPQMRRRVEGVASIRDVAHGAREGRLYLTDSHRHRVLAVAWPPTTAGALPAETIDDDCRGAQSVMRVEDWLVYGCVLGHRLVARRVAPDGALGAPVVIEHDGPIWSFDAAAASGGGLHLLAGGVEDHPLDRTDGGFGYIDSFVFAYDVAADATVTSRPAINASAHGLVTPKRVRWTRAPDAAIATGYGADVVLTLRLSEPPQVTAATIAAGITDFVGTPADGWFADPLLDAWIRTRPGQPPRWVRTAELPRTASSRLGEALVFSTLMAPGGLSEGRRSRFSCETCHFEGRTDGRVHWTGRSDVHATTKTLRGLLANRPHFSRALDKTTAKMVHAEFRVANTGTDQDPWFSVAPADVPWLSQLQVDGLGDPIDPVTLRRAVVDFLADFTPDENPAVHGRTTLTETERRGAALFAEHCVSCHAARTIADDPSTDVAPEGWPALVLSPTGGLVWGSAGRHETGPEPLVHPDGPRTPSLRRLWVKRPLLTNGSAATVEDVLASVRLGVDAVHGAGAGTELDATSREALAAFLDLL